MAITFDSVNRRIIRDSTFVEVRDVYSRWKEWVQAGNAEFPAAFRVVGGDPLAGGLFISSYFFLLNGWRIRPLEQDQTLTIEGNIAVDGGGVPVVPTLGTFNVVVQYVIPVAAQAYDASGSGGSASAEEIAAAVLSALNGTSIPVNLVKIRNQNIIGTGTEANPWGPA